MKTDYILIMARSVILLLLVMVAIGAVYGYDIGCGGSDSRLADSHCYWALGGNWHCEYYTWYRINVTTPRAINVYMSINSYNTKYYGLYVWTGNQYGPDPTPANAGVGWAGVCAYRTSQGMESGCQTNLLNPGYYWIRIDAVGFYSAGSYYMSVGCSCYAMYTQNYKCSGNLSQREYVTDKCAVKYDTVDNCTQNYCMNNDRYFSGFCNNSLGKCARWKENCADYNYYGPKEYYCNNSNLYSHRKYHMFGCTPGKCNETSSKWVNDTMEQFCKAGCFNKKCADNLEITDVNVNSLSLIQNSTFEVNVSVMVNTGDKPTVNLYLINSNGSTVYPYLSPSCNGSSLCLAPIPITNPSMPIVYPDNRTPINVTYNSTFQVYLDSDKLPIGEYTVKIDAMVSKDANLIDSITLDSKLVVGDYIAPLTNSEKLGFFPLGSDRANEDDSGGGTQLGIVAVIGGTIAAGGAVAVSFSRAGSFNRSPNSFAKSISKSLERMGMSLDDLYAQMTPRPRPTLVTGDFERRSFNLPTELTSEGIAAFNKGIQDKWYAWYNDTILNVNGRYRGLLGSRQTIPRGGVFIDGKSGDVWLAERMAQNAMMPMVGAIPRSDTIYINGVEIKTDRSTAFYEGEEYSYTITAESRFLSADSDSPSMNFTTVNQCLAEAAADPFLMYPELAICMSVKSTDVGAAFSQGYGQGINDQTIGYFSKYTDVGGAVKTIIVYSNPITMLLFEGGEEWDTFRACTQNLDAAGYCEGYMWGSITGTVASGAATDAVITVPFPFDLALKAMDTEFLMRDFWHIHELEYFQPEIPDIPPENLTWGPYDPLENDPDFHDILYPPPVPETLPESSNAPLLRIDPDSCDPEYCTPINNTRTYVCSIHDVDSANVCYDAVPRPTISPSP